MSRFHISTLTLLSFLLMAPVLRADQVANTGDQFTLVPVGAREAAMGGDFSAFSDGAFSVFGNPAASASLPGGNLSLSHVLWFAGSNFENLGLTQNVEGVGTLGLGLDLYWIPSFDNTGGVESAFSATSYQGILSYATPLGLLGMKGLAFGLSGHYIVNNFSGMASTNDEALDLGVYYQTPWEPLKFGFNMKDIALSSPTYASLPLSYSYGFALGKGPLLVVGEALMTSGQDTQFQGGGEIWAADILAFRAGFRSQTTSGSFFGPSGGVGLRLGNAFDLDYAVASYGDLGLVQWISLNIDWNDNAASRNKPVTQTAPVPAVETPTPQPTIEPAKRTTVKPVATVIPDFPLRGEVSGNNVVQLNWDPQHGAVAYNVYVSLVPGAGFKKATDDPILTTVWNQQTGLHAITFYYQVKAVDTNGTEFLVSEVRPVAIP